MDDLDDLFADLGDLDEIEAAGDLDVDFLDEVTTKSSNKSAAKTMSLDFGDLDELLNSSNATKPSGDVPEDKKNISTGGDADGNDKIVL